jgi:hypothetical protein
VDRVHAPKEALEGPYSNLLKKFSHKLSLSLALCKQEFHLQHGQRKGLLNTFVKQPHWCTVQQILDEEKSKCASLAQQNGCSPPFLLQDADEAGKRQRAKPNTCF